LSWLAVRNHVGLAAVDEPRPRREADFETGSPAETRAGSAEAMQPQDLQALGYVGAPPAAPRVAAPPVAAPPATAPTYPSRFYAPEREAVAADTGAPQQRVSAPAEAPAGLSMGLTARRRSDAPRPSAAAQRMEAPPQLGEEADALAGEPELDREAEGARDSAAAGQYMVRPSVSARSTAASAPATAAPEPQAEPAPVAPAPVAPPPQDGGRAANQRRGDVVFKSAAGDPFVDSEDDRLSTFTFDVGSGSYDLVRRYLAGGTLPPPETVRVEEIVNAFDYRDAAPARSDFALFAEAASDPWAPAGRYVLVRFAVKAREARRGVAEPAIALDARVQVEVDPRYVSRWRLLCHDDRDTGGERFRDAALDAVAVRPGQAVSALYELELRPDAPPTATLAVLRVRWRPTAGSEPRELHQPLRRGAVASTWDRASRGFRLATVAGRFAEVLRGSYWAQGDDLAELRRRATSVGRDWPGVPRVAELRGLVERAGRVPSDASRP
ncbi:MAG TPA: von Willebrand factor type A domain-containing protein, partial [Thermoanaerobaculia bacterium]|nr:von Willebrand factor type A domain-containing protein [Thermoanaerobaculia bacterium]